MVFKLPSVSDNVNHQSDLITKYVYQITPKLGHVERGYNIPEWFSNGLGQSIFDENTLNVQIPTDTEINTQAGFDESDILAFMSKTNAKKLLDKEGNPKYNRLVFVRDDQIFNSPTPSSVTTPTEPSNSTSQNDVQSTPEVDEVAKDLSKAQDGMMDKYDKQQSELDKKIQDAVNAIQQTGEYQWARYSGNGYEVSSRGDRRFSAMNATFKPDTIVEGVDVGGRTIEDVYQNVIKRSGKGQAPAADSIIRRPVIESELSGEALQDYYSKDPSDWSYRIGYLPLWQEWAKQNPELIDELRKKAHGRFLTDMFANTRVSQARALAEILNTPTQSQEIKDLNNLTPQDDPENFNDAEQSKQVLESDRTILSNEELKYWNEHGIEGKPRILVASEHTDPVWEKNYQKVIDIIEGRRKVNSWQQIEAPSAKFPKGRWKKVEITGHDFAGFYIVTKHDGLPILKLLQTKIPKLIHFSVTSLGGTQYEPGVMKYNDMLDRIEDYIKQGLDPESVTMRIDPIVPGVTNMQDVENIIKRSVAMGIKRVKFSVMDAYKSTREAFAQFNYDFDTYYGYLPGGRPAFHAKPEVLTGIAQQMLAFKEKYGITLHTCAENINISGIEKDGCLSISAVNNMLGTSIPDVEENQSGQRDGCTCFGGKVDALSGNDKCNSTCWYCYMSQFKNKAHEYYNPDGTLKNDMYTQTRESQQPIQPVQQADAIQQVTQPVQRDLFDNDPVFNHLNDKEKQQGRQFKDYCGGK